MNTIRFRTSKYSAHVQPWPGLRRNVQPMQSAREFREYWLAGIQRIEREDAAYVAQVQR